MQKNQYIIQNNPKGQSAVQKVPSKQTQQPSNGRRPRNQSDDQTEQPEETVRVAKGSMQTETVICTEQPEGAVRGAKSSEQPTFIQNNPKGWPAAQKVKSKQKCRTTLRDSPRHNRFEANETSDPLTTDGPTVVRSSPKGQSAAQQLQSKPHPCSKQI